MSRHSPRSRRRDLSSTWGNIGNGGVNGDSSGSAPSMRGMAGFGRHGADRGDAGSVPFYSCRQRHGGHGWRMRDVCGQPSASRHPWLSRRSDGQVRLLHASRPHPGCRVGNAAPALARFAADVTSSRRRIAERTLRTSPQRTFARATVSHGCLIPASAFARRMPSRMSTHRSMQRTGDSGCGCMCER